MVLFAGGLALACGGESVGERRAGGSGGPSRTGAEAGADAGRGGGSSEGHAGGAEHGGQPGAGEGGQAGSTDGGQASSSGGDPGAGDGGGGAGSGNVGEAGTSGGDNAGVTLLKDLADRYCQAAVACCYGKVSSLDSCVYSVTRSMPLVSVANGAVVVDVPKLERCRAAIDSAVGTCGVVLPSLCEGFYAGTRSLGEACTIRESAGGYHDCVTGTDVACIAVSPPGDFNDVGTCTAPPRGAEGDPCYTTCADDRDCSFDDLVASDAAATVCHTSDSLYCPIGLAQPTCQPTLPYGAKCGTDEECGPGAYCEPDDDIIGHCDTPYPFSGCTSNSDCDAQQACYLAQCVTPTNFSQALGCVGPIFAW